MPDNKRVNDNGRRESDKYCPMHTSIVNGQKEIKAGFKWLIGLHIGEYGIIISVLVVAVLYLVKR